MIFKEIVEKSNFDDVFECLVSNYEKVKTMDKNIVLTGYRDICGLEPSSNKDNLSIVITETEEEGQKFYDVSGRKEGEDITYSLIFDPWEDWVAFNVEGNALEKITPSEIVAHCFWEMTWNGWTLAERNKNVASQKVEYDKGKNLEERAFDLKDTSTQMPDDFLEELIEKYKTASTESLKFDIEIIIEDFIDLELVAPEQLDKIGENFKEEDILNAIEAMRRS